MIIGITGTDGSGKGAVVDFLVRNKNFVHYSSRSLIVAEIEKRSLPSSREQMRLVANDMRRLYGHDVIVQKAFEKMAADKVERAVIESIRTMAEAKTLKSKGGILLAVDADQALRYKRIQYQKSASDKVTFEEFVAHEKIEMNDPDPNGMQKAAVMEGADFTIMNNGSMSELRQEIDNFLKKYL